MTLVADNQWEALVTFDGQTNQRFKFDVKGTGPRTTATPTRMAWPN
jgi:hypothetical protein